MSLYDSDIVHYTFLILFKGLKEGLVKLPAFIVHKYW